MYFPVGETFTLRSTAFKHSVLASLSEEEFTKERKKNITSLINHESGGSGKKL